MEDDANLALAIKRQLRGHDVTTVISVSECRSALGDRRPDLLLLDLHVIDGTGFDVVDELRGSDPRLLSRTILLTGGGMNPVEQRQLDTSDVPVMTKPVPARQLREILESQSSQSSHE